MKEVFTPLKPTYIFAHMQWTIANVSDDFILFTYLMLIEPLSNEAWMSVNESGQWHRRSGGQCFMMEFEYQLGLAYFTPFRSGNWGQYPDTPTSLQHIYLLNFLSLRFWEKNGDIENTTHVLTINNVNSFICVKAPWL